LEPATKPSQKVDFRYNVIECVLAYATFIDTQTCFQIHFCFFSVGALRQVGREKIC